jgi:hypothetical protein
MRTARTGGLAQTMYSAGAIVFWTRARAQLEGRTKLIRFVMSNLSIIKFIATYATRECAFDKIV